MRVLHIDTALEFRGGQAQLARLIHGRNGDLWAGCAGSPLAERLGAPTCALRPDNDPRNVFLIRSAVRKLGVNLVAAHHSHAHNAALLAGVPMVVHRRNHRPPGTIWKYRRATATIAVSGFVRDLCEQAGITHVHVVPDGAEKPEPLAADSERLPPRSPGVVRIVAAGALVRHKGHETLIAALEYLPKAVELVVAGEGPLRGDLERAKYRFPGRVFLPGQLRGVGSLCASADVFVQPSLDEALGSVVIEAMALGCRVVTTDAGGLPELVGGAGELCQRGNPRALAAAIQRSLAGQAGRGVSRAAEFSSARMVAATSAIYGRYGAGNDDRAV